jgi:hypothetical protein
MSYDNLSSVSHNVLKFYHQLTGEERSIPFICDDFHFCSGTPNFDVFTKMGCIKICKIRQN